MHRQLVVIELAFLESSFIAEVKSDLMGEQTILCGMLQTAAVLGHKQLIAQGVDAAYARKLLQYGLETTTEGLKARRHHQHDGPFIKPCEN